MQTAVVLIFAIQFLLSTALPLHIVLPRDKRSEPLSKEKVTNLKSGIELLFQYLVSTEHVIQDILIRFIICRLKS